MMFFKKKFNKYRIVLWDDRSEQEVIGQIRMKIRSVQPFSRKTTGFRNSPNSMGFISDAMEIIGENLDPDDEDQRFIYFVVPEFEIDGLPINGEVVLSLAKKHSCIKIEKVAV